MDRAELRSKIGIVCALAFIGMLIVVAVREPGQRELRRRSLDAWAVEIGAGLYDQHCRSCHGSRGEGVGQLGPSLNDKSFFTQRLKEVGWPDTLKAYIVATSSHGRLMATRPRYAGDEKTAVMSPWLNRYGGPLRPDEIENVAAFILNWKATALGKIKLIALEIPKTNLNDPAAVERGKLVFQKNCAACHGISDISPTSPKGPDLDGIRRLAGQRASGLSAEEYLRESFLLPQAYVVEGFNPNQEGHSCGGVLSVRQLDEVVAFLLSRI